MVNHVAMIVPLVLYFVLIMGIAWLGNRFAAKRADTAGFMEEYFIGSRSMGGFVLAMAVITTYTSASSFVGGPGIAYNLGLGWILLSMIQVPTAFLTLGVLGKRFALIARRTKAVTITDFIRARYDSDAVVILSSAALLVFFMASMLAQFIGGARLFESVTGYSYQTGLIIFGLTVVIYTTVGGFRAVVLTDTIQGVMMLVASLAILFAVVTAGGGVGNIMQTLYTIDPKLLTPTGANDAIPKPFILSFWVLVGIGVLGLPQTTQKCLGYKDSRSMHSAMIIGTFTVGFILLAMHLVGAMGRAVIPDIEIGDLAVPTLTVRLMSPFWAGIFIAGAARRYNVHRRLDAYHVLGRDSQGPLFPLRPEKRRDEAAALDRQAHEPRGHGRRRRHSVHSGAEASVAARMDKPLRLRRPRGCILLPDSLRPLLEARELDRSSALDGRNTRSSFLLHTDEDKHSGDERHRPDARDFDGALHNREPLRARGARGKAEGL